jgi:predicted Zn-dependent peptidase
MDFYKTFYVPNNAVLSIAGDINIEECKKLVYDYFAEIPKGTTDIPRPNIIEPKKEAEIRDTIYDNIQLPAVFHGFHIPAQGTEDFYAVDMLNQLLSVGESSRLNKSLVEESQKAVYCGAFTFNLEDPGMTIALAMTNSEEDPKDVETLMDLEYEKVQTELITDREFQKLRNQIENDFIQSNYKMYDIAENLANYHLFYGNTNLINTEIDKYLTVTKEDILNAAKKYYNKENRVTLYYLPKENN